MHVHLIAVAGTGMGALAGLLRSLGHDVSGSDTSFDPPMGPALQTWGIRLMKGFDPSHLTPPPDLVVVGNVCRSNNSEARAAIDLGLRVMDMAHALADLGLHGTSPLVVAGTHGKTTTTSMCAWVLDQAHLGPGFLIGGIPKNFGQSFRAASKSSPAPSSVRAVPFVVEGDEYDTAFFEKTPKFWHYCSETAILTSIEHDHIDIYPTMDRYLDAFEKFVARIPENGLLVANAADEDVVAVVRKNARCPVKWFALRGDKVGVSDVDWWGELHSPSPDGQPFSVVRASGTARTTVSLGVPGEHNVRNALAAIAVSVDGYGVSVELAAKALEEFRGVARRQDLLGTPASVTVYDDFGHHPTAVNETLRAIRAKHPSGKLIAVFEPRSATACRNLHQDAYAHAFGAADRVVIAPIGRATIPENERLDVPRIVAALNNANIPAHAASDVDDIIDHVVGLSRSGDIIVLLSNGAFGGIHQRLIDALAQSAGR